MPIAGPGTDKWFLSADDVDPSGHYPATSFVCHMPVSGIGRSVSRPGGPPQPWGSAERRGRPRHGLAGPAEYIRYPPQERFRRHRDGFTAESAALPGLLWNGESTILTALRCFSPGGPLSRRGGGGGPGPKGRRRGFSRRLQGPVLYPSVIDHWGSPAPLGKARKWLACSAWYRVCSPDSI